MNISLETTDEKYGYVGKNEKGHELVFNGDGNGVSPMEAVLMSAAACSSVDIELILGKMRTPANRVEVTVKSTRAEEAPRVFKSIHLHYTVYGDLVESKVKRAIELSTEKYCSVLLMLEKSVDIEATFSIEG